jgi:hypothetical protein
LNTAALQERGEAAEDVVIHIDDDTDDDDMTDDTDDD